MLSKEISMVHHTVGVYPNGDMKQNGVIHENLEEHIEYNIKFRFGRALFVDGKCVYPGFVNDSTLKEATIKIACLPKITHDTQPYH